MYIFYRFSFFLSQTLMIAKERRGHVLFLSTTSICSGTFRHLFATLHVKRLPHIFHHIACNYQIVTWWVLWPYWITILTDWWCNVCFCLFTWWFDPWFLLQQFDGGNLWILTHINYHPCITSEPVLVTPCYSYLT